MNPPRRRPNEAAAELTHVVAWQSLPNVELAAICTSSQRTAEIAARAHGISHAYGDALRMIADPPLEFALDLLQGRRNIARSRGLVGIVENLHRHSPAFRQANHDRRRCDRRGSELQGLRPHQHLAQSTDRLAVSIRIPSSWCGVYGMKPTTGLVPYTGILGFDPVLDRAGPMTSSVEDNALFLEVLAGSDGLDPRQVNPRVDAYTRAQSRRPPQWELPSVSEFLHWRQRPWHL